MINFGKLQGCGCSLKTERKANMTSLKQILAPFWVSKAPKLEPSPSVKAEAIKQDEIVKIEEVIETHKIEIKEAPKQIEASKQPKALLEAAPIVSFQNVTKKFGDKIAIHDVTFEVHDVPNMGEMVALVGPSGCGKSTILRIIAGLEPQFPPTSGKAFVAGGEITGSGIDRGVVDQKYSLLPHLTVIDNISFGLKLNGTGRKERRDKAREWVKKIGLEGSEDKFPQELSGGMQQRVSLAATLILQPKILLMDEPFGALDPKMRLKMQELLVELWKEIQGTVIIVTHSMDEAVYLGDRIFRMEANPGRLVEILKAPRPDISPEEMRKKKWFFEMVRELQDRVENSKTASGELEWVNRAMRSSKKTEKQRGEDIDEVSLLKLIG